MSVPISGKLSLDARLRVVQALASDALRILPLDAKFLIEFFPDLAMWTEQPT